MRLGALTLTRFGHFTDFTLEFPRGEAGDFHIILGSNEAGKSTIVEAWLNFLYGIPANSNYNFRHERDTLEVSARVEDGTKIHQLTRLRRASNSLVGPDGRPLPEAILTGLLRGIGEGAYRHLYCLDDDTIEKGGEDILASKGDLGQLLFAAASGLAAFNEMLELEREADRAFHVARGKGRRGTRLHKLRQELSELDARIREVDLTVPEYRRLREEFERAEAAEVAAREAHAALVARHQALDAKLRALPMRAQYDALRESLAKLGPQPTLGDGIAAEIAGLSERRKEHLAAIATRRANVADWIAERDRLEVDPRAERLADALAGLGPLRSMALTAAEHLPRRKEEREELERGIRRILDALGIGGEDPAGLRLTVPALDRLDRAVHGQARAERDLENAAREFEIARKTLEQQHRSMPASKDEEMDPDAIAAAMAGLDAERVAESLTAARRTHGEASEAARQALGALALGGRSFTAPVPVPLTPEGAGELASAIDVLERELAALEDRVAEDDRHVSALAADLATLAAQGTAPRDAEAAALRAERDRLWSEHRAALTAATADAYAGARTDDDHASALRLAEAARIAELRRVERDHARMSAERDARIRQRDRAIRALEAARAELAGVLDAIGLPTGLDAATLATWLRAHGAAFARCVERDQAAAILEDAEARAMQVAGPLATALGAEPADLVRLVAEAREKLGEASAQKTLRAAASRTLNEAKDALQSRQVALEQARSALEEANGEMSEALAAFGCSLPEHVRPGDALPRMRALAGELDKRASLDDRIVKMEASASEFAAAIGALAGSWAELAGRPALEQAAALDRIAADYGRAAQRRLDLEEEIARARTAIERAECELQKQEDRAAEIALAWDVADRPQGFAAIAAAIGAAQVAADLRQRIADSERALVAALETERPEDVMALLSSENEIDLRTSMEVLAPELKQAEESRDAAIRSLSLAGKALGDVSGDNDAARLAEDRRLLLEEIREEAEQGLRRRIGLVLAERALGRYRDQHRGSMLAATEEVFVDLTGGAYSGLSAQRDGNRETLIVHRASDGRSLRADEKTMSKGTRFQLYFALRLAGYRQMAEAGTVLPFLCDDIFETFDENRTASACRLMHRIGGIGQALYFTHHAHVAEIAQRECPGVHIHRL